MHVYNTQVKFLVLERAQRSSGFPPPAPSPLEFLSCVTKSTTLFLISCLGYRTAGYLFVYSSNMFLSAYYVPGPFLDPGNTAVNKTDKTWLFSWGSDSSAERQTIDKIN